jgi:hypothetical protein
MHLHILKVFPGQHIQSHVTANLVHRPALRGTGGDDLPCQRGDPLVGNLGALRITLYLQDPRAVLDLPVLDLSLLGLRRTPLSRPIAVYPFDHSLQQPVHSLRAQLAEPVHHFGFHHQR